MKRQTFFLFVIAIIGNFPEWRFTGLGGIIDYLNTGSASGGGDNRNYYSPYTIYVQNSSYFNNSHSWNVTSEQNNLDSFYLIKSQTNITLNKGWNLIGLLFDQTDSETDRNISIAEGWNLIGHSADTDIPIANLIFTNSSGSRFTWAQALSNNKVQAYLAYYDSSSATASERKYKYVATSDLGMDSSVLTKDKGYWFHSNQDGNLTIPGVGGSLANESYLWRKLRFGNGSGSELNVTEAGLSDGVGWVDEFIQYWDNGGFRYVYGNLDEGDSIIFEPQRGYFIKSFKDNITLIRQN